MAQACRTTIQANVFRSTRAPDLLLQTIAEREEHLAVIAEPHWIPDSSGWFRGMLETVVLVGTGSSASAQFREFEGECISRWTTCRAEAVASVTGRVGVQRDVHALRVPPGRSKRSSSGGLSSWYVPPLTELRQDEHIRPLAGRPDSR
ncbi:unnamed protein product [Heterotrigona itama]|uniref:Uncharacterized protein n=1 Tax=Heterotrigona itama TaxID=395501 RepID=A0A6V7HJT2_9HYME|nr:unnamed protein product [Heterotrigona itama]